MVSSPGGEGEIGGDGLERCTRKRHEAHQRLGVVKREERARANCSQAREAREDDGGDCEPGVPVGTPSLA